AAIRTRRIMAQSGYSLQTNAEQHLRTRPRLASLESPEALAQTLATAQRSTLSLDEFPYEYPIEIVPACATPTSHLRQQVYAGMRRRYPDEATASVVALVEKELALISELEYEPYFLTVYDIVQYARRNNILCQGRGSAANSAVCYCLGITAVPPDK